MHFLYRHCGLISYLYLVNSLDSDFMSYLTERAWSPLMSWGLSDPPAALAHRVGQIIVRNPLHGTFLVFQCNCEVRILGSLRAWDRWPYSASVLSKNAHPSASGQLILGLKKTRWGGPFLWMSIFSFMLGFTIFEMSASFCLFRFLDRWNLSTHFRSSASINYRNFGSYPTQFLRVVTNPVLFLT